MSTGTERDSQRPAKRQKGQDDRKKSPPPPDFKLSGQLAKEANNHNGIALKYCEPLESRKPTEKYRFHIFKGKDQVDILQLFNQSAYLLGRDRKVADIPIDHPSCSKQHAALQYRQSISTDEFGGTVKAIKPYIIDLESANGTFVNKNKVPKARYVELKVGDVVSFGFSSREYVLMVETDD